MRSMTWRALSINPYLVLFSSRGGRSLRHLNRLLLRLRPPLLCTFRRVVIALPRAVVIVAVTQIIAAQIEIESKV